MTNAARTFLLPIHSSITALSVQLILKYSCSVMARRDSFMFLYQIKLQTVKVSAISIGRM